jgi:hypothetical protein
MKSQIKTTVDSIISRQDQAEERILLMKYNQGNTALRQKKKINSCKFNLQELWT